MNYREAKETKELHCLRILARHAPKMAIGEAGNLASEYGTTFADMMTDAEALAILAERFKHEDVFHTDAERVAVLRAIDHANYRHYWAVCGPVDDAMEKLMLEWDQRKTVS